MTQDSTIPQQLTGRYFAPGGSASVDANLRDNGADLVVTEVASGEVHHVQFRELADRLGSLPRKIYFQDGSLFECADNDAVDLAFGKDRHFATQLTKAEGSWKFAIVALVLTVVSLAGLYRYGLPAAASFAAWATPDAVVELINKGALDSVDRAFLKPSTMPEADRQRYRAIFAELAEASGEDVTRFDLQFRDGGRIGANALALPGGTVILTDQLAKLAKNDDEVAGVLAHEIGHVIEQHSLRQIYRALGIAFMASVIIGDTSQLIDNVIAQAAVLDTFSFSRAFEHDADEVSVEIMIKAGRDPVAFVDLLERIFEEAGVDGNDTNWLSTHPGNEDRRENVMERIEQLQ